MKKFLKRGCLFFGIAHADAHAHHKWNGTDQDDQYFVNEITDIIKYIEIAGVTTRCGTVYKGMIENHCHNFRQTACNQIGNPR